MADAAYRAVGSFEVDLLEGERMRLSVGICFGFAILCALVAGCPEEPGADGTGAGIPENASCEDLVTRIEALAKKKGCLEDDRDDYLQECAACPAYTNYLRCMLSSEDNFYCRDDGEEGELEQNRDACVDSCSDDDDEDGDPSES